MNKPAHAEVDALVEQLLADLDAIIARRTADALACLGELLPAAAPVAKPNRPARARKGRGAVDGAPQVGAQREPKPAAAAPEPDVPSREPPRPEARSSAGTSAEPAETSQEPRSSATAPMRALAGTRPAAEPASSVFAGLPLATATSTGVLPRISRNAPPPDEADWLLGPAFAEPTASEAEVPPQDAAAREAQVLEAVRFLVRATAAEVARQAALPYAGVHVQLQRLVEQRRVARVETGRGTEYGLVSTGDVRPFKRAKSA